MRYSLTYIWLGISLYLIELAYISAILEMSSLSAPFQAHC